MVTTNGTKPVTKTKPLTITVDGETYEARDMSSTSYADKIRGDALSIKLQDMRENMRAYADLAFDFDDDDDDDEPPEELVEEYRLTHLNLIRYGFPTMPKKVIREMPEDDVNTYATAFLAYMTEHAQNVQRLDPTRRGRKTRKASASKSRS